nr:metallophosphoesterase [Modestobacter muralis]
MPPLRVGLVAQDGAGARGCGGRAAHGWSSLSRTDGRVVGRCPTVSGCDDAQVPISVVFISDTHLPKRARDLPAELWQRIEDADVVVHAGDWVDVALLDELEQRSRRLVGVYGNNDHGVLRQRLPAVARVELAGVRVAVVHETGDAAGRERRCAERFPDTDVLVFGHSHIPWDSTAPGGLRLLNPGSPTDRRRQPHPTYLTAVVGEGRLDEVVLHRLPVRTR